ncbi:helix-turn-helix transcriptional regulator [Novosphingobium mathurense]|uniref:Prophage CP4-57 regulatory protein (AlpA) n=1 Tax=Novosphingobium mathurense TaxID=428990 RepID=A0A1U6IHK5_9SPHN|nr:AlpA family phage regulatory protein [Novosphingobium mathurense]SLK07501.1 Prophage CP4-57 regulatory protein (AlpA) [Novosphingobium mathurense]
MTTHAHDGPMLYGRSDLRRRGIKVSNDTLLRWEREGRFPVRLRPGRYVVAWYASEIEDYLLRLGAERGIG